MQFERERELASLRAVLASARERQGGVALVFGEAGIGKTSLLEAAAAEAADDGARVFRARGATLEREFGFGVVRQLFERALVQAGEEERAALLAGAAAPAGTAVGVSGIVHPAPGGDTAFAVQHGLYWLACNLADTAPVVLLIDDAQWSDAASLRWLTYLATRLDGVAISVLVAWRTGEPGTPDELFEVLRTEAGAESVTPRPLSAQATAAMVRAALGDSTDARYCTACHEATGGNPFFVTALLDALRGGVIDQTLEGTRRIQQIGPAAVRQSVLLRLSRLGDKAIALARAVSVLDTDAEPTFAYALAKLDPIGGAEAAASLERARILDAGHVLRFAHPILRAAVYEDLTPAQRSVEHRRAGQLLIEHGGDADRAAVHLLATQPAGDPQVVEWLRQAAHRAIARGVPETALALVDRALAEGARHDLRPALLLTAGRASQTMARPEAKRYLIEAHREATEPLLRSEAAVDLARAIWHGRPGDAVTVLRQSLAELPPGERDVADHVRLELLMIETTTGARPPAEVERDLKELQQNAELGSPARIGAACVLTWHHELWNAHLQADAVAELAHELRDVRPLIDSYGADFVPLAFAATVLADLDHLATAEVMFNLMLDAAARTGSAFAFNLAATCRASHAAHRGDFSEAESEARTTLHVVTVTGSWSGRRGALYPLVWALTGRGAYDEAEATLAAHGLEAEAGHSLGIDTNLLLARSMLRLHQGRYRDAGADITRGLEQRRWPNPLSRINVWAPRVLAAAGDRDRAHEIGAKAVAAARAGRFKGQLGIALHSTGLAHRGEHATALLREAAEVLAHTPWRWEHAEALVDLGAALRRGNHRTEARGPLREGLDLAVRIGAAPLVERAREELIATGARPRHVVTTGVDSLTASERRVSALAAEGLSISEMAQRLFVTRKTVETHLYAAYRKLDVSSREGLERALALHEQNHRPILSATGE